MNKFANFIVKNHIFFFVFFLIIAGVCGSMMTLVKTNYDNATYLPQSSETAKGIEVMEDEFGAGGSLKAVIKDATVLEALSFKNELETIAGIESVMWVDDLLGLLIPTLQEQYTSYYFSMFGMSVNLTEDNALNYIIYFVNSLPENIEDINVGNMSSDDRIANDEGYASFVNFLVNGGVISFLSSEIIVQIREEIKSFYTNESALFQVSFLEGDYSQLSLDAITSIKNLSDNTYLTGQSFLAYNNIEVITNETTNALIVACIIAFVLLLVFSTSYFEPLIFLIVIGVGILINMGTNLFLGEISYLTQSVACILQLALTMDYSIFLLHRFKQERNGGMDVGDAMKSAIAKTFSPISASSFTTIASFVALLFMQYTIGFDIGMVLGKGVLISIVCVFFFMPALIMFSYKLIEKSAHKTINFQFEKFGNFLNKSRFIIPIICLCLIIPAIIFSYQNDFVYGNESSSSALDSEYMIEKLTIEENFGNQNQIVILLDDDYQDKELQISQTIIMLDKVSEVQSLSLIESSTFYAYLPEAFMSQFTSENYSRIVIGIDVKEEGLETENLLNQIKSSVEGIIGTSDDSYFVIGSSSATVDIKNYIEKDYIIVTIISLLLIAIIIAIAFRSIIIPIILLLVIQSSIWINMAIPFLMGDSLIFIGYLLVSAIQLGATVDYAILFTSFYKENRRNMDKISALKNAFRNSYRAITISASILCFASLSAGLCSSMIAVSSLCLLISRGAFCSFVLVFVLLPQLLLIFDKFIKKKQRVKT